MIKDKKITGQGGQAFSPYTKKPIWRIEQKPLSPLSTPTKYLIIIEWTMRLIEYKDIETKKTYTLAEIDSLCLYGIYQII